MGLNPPWAFAHISRMKFLKIKISYPKNFFLPFDLYTCTFYASCYLSKGNNFLLIWEMISSCSEPSELDSIVWIVNKNSFHFHILTLLHYIHFDPCKHILIWVNSLLSKIWWIFPFYTRSKCLLNDSMMNSLLTHTIFKP